MARNKPRDPVGSVSGFPYSILWEEFPEWWEGFRCSGGDVAKFESLIAECDDAGHSLPKAVSRSAISELLAPLKLRSGNQQDLADTLYGLAAKYLIPKIRQTLGRSPIQIERRLGGLAKKATAFADALEDLDLDVEIVLGLHRPILDTPARPNPPLFHFKQLVAEARDLAKAAALMADEMPRRAQGTSVDLHEKGWVHASLRAMESAGTGPVRVLQADRAGRNPRPDGVPAQVLFEYLRLVEPGMPDSTKVRLILEFTAPYREAERMWARHLKANV